MGFNSGTISFRRYWVGAAAEPLGQALLDRLAANALRPEEIGPTEQISYGWCGARHAQDVEFSFEQSIFADCLYFALRIDTNKVPGDLKNTYRMMEEQAAAAANPSGFISKAQKIDARETVRRKVDEDLQSGRFRRSKMIPMLWDIQSGILYTSANGKSFEMLFEIFERTFGLILVPLTAGSMAQRFLEPLGRRRDYEDMRPTRFAAGPEGAGQFPDYRWVLKGPEPKDFVGNEFLLWLWHEADHKSGIIKTETKGVDEVTVFIDRALDLDCAYGWTGSDSLRGDGPSRTAEAMDGLRSGKVPRKAGLLLHSKGQDFKLNLNPEGFVVSGGLLPDVEEADTPRVLFEERIALLRALAVTIDALFETFLKLRASSAWEGHVNRIQRWITRPAKVDAQLAPAPA